MRMFAFYGILYEIALNFYKPFSIKFLERIGGSDFDITLFNALPGLVTLIAILPGAIWLRRSSDKKRTTRGMILTGRFFLLAMALVPIVPQGYRAMLFLGLFTMMCIPDAIYQTSYQSFIGDLFEPRARATAIGMRNKLTVPAMTAVTLICGNLLVWMPKTEDQRLLIYQIFFVLAFVFGVTEFMVFKRFKMNRQIENASSGPVGERWLSVVKRILKDKSFVFFALCSLGFHFGWQMGWPLFNIYIIRNLGANELWLAIISVVSSITMFFGYSFWSRQIDQRGNSVVLPVCSFGMALTPLMYAWSPNLYVLLVMALVSGFFTSGTLSVLLSALLEATPEKDRVMYIAVYNVLINVSLAVSPLIGHYFLESRGIFFALYMTGLFRFLGSLLFFYRDRKLAGAQVRDAS
jgi:MFS family permease